MRFLLTYYVDADPSTVEGELAQAVSRGLDSAAELVGDARNETQTETIEGGIRVNGGLDALNGSEIRVSGTDRLTTVQVAVPWSDSDIGSPKLWAAARFAGVVTDEVGLAA
jgi:hypothetical protein